MKAFFLSLALFSLTLPLQAQDGPLHIYETNPDSRAGPTKRKPDTLLLTVDGTNAYYQKTVKVDSNIMESMIYLRALEFMAAKNFQQNYGYEQEGKLICTTTQDLNTNQVYIGDDQDVVDPFTVQFSIIMDMKNRKYRYTISNVVFYRPTDNGNRRLTLYDMYVKSTNPDSRRVAKDAKKVISSFEDYIGALTDELYDAVEKKSSIHNEKF